MAWRSVVISDVQPKTNLPLVKLFPVFPSALLGSTVICWGESSVVRHSLFGRENAVALEFLDQDGGGEVNQIQNLRLVERRKFLSSERNTPSDWPIELRFPAVSSRNHVW